MRALPAPRLLSCWADIACFASGSERNDADLVDTSVSSGQPAARFTMAVSVNRELAYLLPWTILGHSETEPLKSLATIINWASRAQHSC
jgi:hypothetical protein